MQARSLFEPPRSLMLALIATTMLATAALGWLGWRLVVQERALDVQRETERREMGRRSALAAWQTRLADWSSLSADIAPSESPAGAIALRFAAADFKAYPPERLVYLPFPTSGPEPPEAPFAEGERSELEGDETGAAAHYEKLSRDPDVRVRAGAWLRIGRCLRRLGREEKARQAYRRLSEIRGVRVAGVPVELLGLHALGEFGALRVAMREGRWRLTRGQFLHYWPDEEAPPEAELAESAVQSWRHWRDASAPEGEWTEGAWTLLWRGNAAYLLPAESLRPGAEAVRPPGSGSQREREALIVGGLAVVVAFLAAGSYFIGRAIRREVEVARMKQDFVSAVSHEFRTPLTSIRQFAEILAAGRITNDDRRMRYYLELEEQAGRLQRLVDTLLNFGLMESGARQYRLVAVSLPELVERIVREFPLDGSGRRIERIGGSLMVQADGEALGVVLRNLIDNALKYSPGQPAVWVEWRREGTDAVVSVRDRGVGIPSPERTTIFQKFCRGSAAAATQAGGSGVGLAMVAQIASAHGSEIELESVPGQGSTFTLRLRLAGEGT
jgi:signal transduction histidine kinase